MPVMCHFCHKILNDRDDMIPVETSYRSGFKFTRTYIYLCTSCFKERYSEARRGKG